MVFTSLMQLPHIPEGMHVTSWPPTLATRGPGMQTALHSHHSLHFMLAIEGELRFNTSPTGQWSSAAGVLTAPHAAHAIDARGFEILLVFLDPESDAGTAFGPALDHPVRPILAMERAVLVRDVVPRTILRSGAARWVQTAAEVLRVVPPPKQRAVHPGIRKLLSMLRTSGLDEPTTLDALASAVGLSPGRLMHVFTTSVGIPLRPYLAWLRVQRAAIAIVTGSSLTEASHTAGFSDAAHMSRTFRRMLGVTPSVLRPMRCSQNVQD